jgi:hypothetical protein
MLSSEADSGRKKTNFKKQREFFLHNRMKNKNLSHFFIYTTIWENRSYLSASFFVFSVLSVSVLFLRALFRRAGDEIEETERDFCLKHAHIQ